MASFSLSLVEFTLFQVRFYTFVGQSQLASENCIHEVSAKLHNDIYRVWLVETAKKILSYQILCVSQWSTRWKYRGFFYFIAKRVGRLTRPQSMPQNNHISLNLYHNQYLDLRPSYDFVVDSTEFSAFIWYVMLTQLPTHYRVVPICINSFSK